MTRPPNILITGTPGTGVSFDSSGLCLCCWCCRQQSKGRSLWCHISQQQQQQPLVLLPLCSWQCGSRCSDTRQPVGFQGPVADAFLLPGPQMLSFAPTTLSHVLKPPPPPGKTTTGQVVAESSGLRYINVGDWVKEQGLHCGFDVEHQAYIIDEDKVRIRMLCV